MMQIGSGLWWTIGLCLLVAVIFILPLLPALIELRWPVDAMPLKVVRQYDSNVANFALGFGRYIDTTFAKALAKLGPTDIRQVSLRAGGQGVLLGASAQFALERGQSDSLTVQHLLVGAGDVHLPDHVLYEAEVYAAANFSSGDLSAFRAVLAGKEAVLGGQSVVLRWIHAGGDLTVGRGAQLYGRASSDQGIALAVGVTFERLHAPRIIFGTLPIGAPLPGEVPHVLHKFAVGSKLDLQGRVWRVPKGVTMPPSSLCESALVSHGNAQVGARSWLQQSLKCHGDILLESQCRVDGTVVATGGIVIGPDCQVQGPVISEGLVVVRRGCTVGTAASPTSISAPRIVIEDGVVVFGSVWAREQGEVSIDKTGERV